MPLSAEIKEPHLAAEELKEIVKSGDWSKLRTHYYLIGAIDPQLLKLVEQSLDCSDKTWFIEDIIEFVRNNQDKIFLDFFSKAASIVLHLYLNTAPSDTELERRRMLATVQWLLNKGADLAVTDSQGNTPLHHVFLKYLPLDLMDIFSMGSAGEEDKPVAIWKIHNHAGQTPEQLARERLPPQLQDIITYYCAEQPISEQEIIGKLLDQTMELMTIVTEQREKHEALQKTTRQIKQEFTQYKLYMDKKIQNMEVAVNKLSVSIEPVNTTAPAESSQTPVRFSPVLPRKKDKEESKLSLSGKKFSTLRGKPKGLGS